MNGFPSLRRAKPVEAFSDFLSPSINRRSDPRNTCKYSSNQPVHMGLFGLTNLLKTCFELKHGFLPSFSPTPACTLFFNTWEELLNYWLRCTSCAQHRQRSSTSDKKMIYTWLKHTCTTVRTNIHYVFKKHGIQCTRLRFSHQHLLLRWPEQQNKIAFCQWPPIYLLYTRI